MKIIRKKKIEKGGIRLQKNQKYILKKNPLISVITVVKNDEKNIGKTIKSVLNQNFKDYELIVIDGNSTDKTLDIIKKFNKSIDFWISKPDKNLWEAMNTGIRFSKGKIIGILNSKDIFYKSTLEIVNKYFKKNKIDFLFGSVKKNKVYSGFSPEKIYYKFNIYPSHSIGFFIKKKSQLKIGKYDTNLKYCSDYDLFYRMIVKKKMKGIATKRTEVFGKFNLSGLSSKVSFLELYYYEMIVRYKNGQFFFYLFVLFFLKILNKFIYVFLKFIYIKK